MKPTILVIDDNPDLRELLQYALKRGGFSVMTAKGGVEALDTLNQKETPDLVLVDVDMPGMSGTQFLDAVEKSEKDFFRKCGFAYCTAGDVPSDSRVVGHLNKFADFSDMLVSVKKLISGSPQNLQASLS